MVCDNAGINKVLLQSQHESIDRHCVQYVVITITRDHGPVYMLCVFSSGPNVCRYVLRNTVFIVWYVVRCVIQAGDVYSDVL